MADTYYALKGQLQLFRGMTQKVRIELFTKAAGGDSILGRPTAQLALGAAEDWTDYPNIRAAMAPAALAATPIDLDAVWETQNPAVAIVTVSDEAIEAVLAALPADNARVVMTVEAWKETGAVKLESVPVYHVPDVRILNTALRPAE